METENSLSCSQENVTGPYPEPDESSPQQVSFQNWFHGYNNLKKYFIILF